MYSIKVRLLGARRWSFLDGSGGLTHLRLHAGMTQDQDRAEQVALTLLADNLDRVAATRVVSTTDPGRTVAYFGDEPLARTEPVDYSTYRYLVATRGDRGTFHVKDAAGRWANVSEDVYEACYDEAKRVGLSTRRLVIHGCTCTFQTEGMSFIQQLSVEAV